MSVDKNILLIKLKSIFSEADAEIIADILYKSKLFDIVKIQIRNSNDWYDVDKYEFSL